VDIYVGNLSRDLTEQEIRTAFEAFGKVAAVRLVKDRYSGVSRGFGFVEMPDRTEAEAAIQGLNRQELGGRTLDLSEARPPGGGKKGGGRPSGRGGSRPGGGRPGGGRPGGGRPGGYGRPRGLGRGSGRGRFS